MALSVFWTIDLSKARNTLPQGANKPRGQQKTPKEKENGKPLKTTHSTLKNQDEKVETKKLNKVSQTCWPC